jgi:hypothetical protein
VRRAAIILVIFGTLLAVPSAVANEPLPYSALWPVDSAVKPPSGPVAFRVEGSITNLEASVRVSTSPTVDPEGNLGADADFFGIYTDDGTPGTHAGLSNYVPAGQWWASAPGTYYWQVHGFCIGTPPYGTCPEGFHEYVSPVRKIIIRQPCHWVTRTKLIHHRKVWFDKQGRRHVRRWTTKKRYQVRVCPKPPASPPQANCDPNYAGACLDRTLTTTTARAEAAMAPST